MDRTAPTSSSEEAAAWYARLRAPDCTVQDRAAFDAWLSRDPGNAAAYAAAERMNDALAKLAMADPRLKAMVDQAASGGATIPDDPVDEHPSDRPPTTISAEPVRRASSRRRRPWAWAASVVAAVGGALVVSLLTTGGAEPGAAAAELQSASGRAVRYMSGATRRAVTLDDGTRVYLDVASIIEVRFAATRRDVMLVQGRALFDVAHDSARPFVVTAGADRVTALGTVFQVDRAVAEVVITLAQGAVSVANQSAVAVPLRLVPGEELRMPAGDTRWVKRSVNANAAMSWALGKHIFHDSPLEDAVREINRYADKKVRLSDASIARLLVNGEFATGDSEAIVAALVAALPLHVTPTRAELVLSPERALN
jgi:transmembrane sensor